MTDIQNAMQEMMNKVKSEDVLKESFSIYSWNKKNFFLRVILLVLSGIIAVIISCLNTVNILRDVVTVILDTVLAVFGIIFTGYAFFQALLNDKMVQVLMNDVQVNEKGNPINKLHETNQNFIWLMMQFLMALFSTIILNIILSFMPESWDLFPNMIANIILSTVLISIYFYHIMVIMWRMVGFLFNIYQLFNLYAISKYILAEQGKEE